MKLSGPACTEMMSGAKKSESRERAEGIAGGVRLEREVRQGSAFESDSARNFKDLEVWL